MYVTTMSSIKYVNKIYNYFFADDSKYEDCHNILKKLRLWLFHMRSIESYRMEFLFEPEPIYFLKYLSCSSNMKSAAWISSQYQ